MVQPGVASVQCAILQKAPGSVSFYMRQFDNFEGREYEDVRRRFSGAVVCGYVRKGSWAPRLNPAADEKLQKDDRIVVLAPHGELSQMLLCPRQRLQSSTLDQSLAWSYGPTIANPSAFIAGSITACI